MVKRHKFADKCFNFFVLLSASVVVLGYASVQLSNYMYIWTTDMGIKECGPIPEAVLNQEQGVLDRTVWSPDCLAVIYEVNSLPTDKTLDKSLGEERTGGIWKYDPVSKESMQLYASNLAKIGRWESRTRFEIKIGELGYIYDLNESRFVFRSRQ